MLFWRFGSLEYFALTLPRLGKVSDDSRESGIVESVSKVEREIAEEPEGIDSPPVAIAVDTGKGEAADVDERLEDLELLLGPLD
jgi:hypothetical protein